MNKIEIEVPYNVRYISEWDDFDNSLLQGHSIINKTITGCGFTHYTLTNDIPTILCSPRKFLLENKNLQLPHTYLVINSGEKSVDVDGGDYNISSKNILNDLEDDKISTDYALIKEICSGITDYIVNCQLTGVAPKILVTYDSLKHVLSVLGEMIQYYSIIVDEFQNIFMDASFKADTELNFLSYLQDCPNVTYLSATPYIEEYLNELDEFKNLPYYELKWHPDRLQTIKVDMRKTFNIGSEVDKIIQDYLSGNYPEKVDDKGVVHQSKEVVFYVNSVRLINAIVKRNNLTADNTNIICADTDKNRRQIGKYSLLIGSAPLKGEPHKLFTFCTRTTYAGADFYSPCALSVVVSDCKIDSLSTDIRMDFPQIMGRQRLKENVFRDECIFIYKLSDSEITMEEFEKRSKEKLRLTQEDISNFKSLSLTRGSCGTSRMISDFQWRIKTKRYREDYTGISGKTGEPIVNKLVLLSERRAYELRSNVYKNEVQVYNEFASITTTLSYEDSLKKVRLLDEIRKLCYQTNQFYIKMKAVCELLLDPQWFGHIHISDLYWLPLEYRNYLNYLGPERIKANGYKEIDLKREMQSLVSKGDIKDEFIKTFIIGKRYSMKEAKFLVQKIYNENDIKKTGKASELTEYFVVKEVKIYDPSSKKQSAGYEILSIK